MEKGNYIKIRRLIERIFDIEKEEEISRIREDCSRTYSLAVHDSNKKLFFGTVDNAVKVYDLETKTIEKSLKGHKDSVWVLQISSDKSYLVSGGSDGLVFIWDLKEGYRIVKRVNFGKNIFCLALSSLNRNLYVAGSQYKSVVRVNMRKVLKLSPEEFTKAMVMKKKKGDVQKQNKSISRPKSPKKNQNEKSSPENEFAKKAIRKVKKKARLPLNLCSIGASSFLTPSPTPILAHTELTYAMARSFCVKLDDALRFA